MRSFRPVRTRRVPGSPRGTHRAHGLSWLGAIVLLAGLLGCGSSDEQALGSEASADAAATVGAETDVAAPRPERSSPSTPAPRISESAAATPSPSEGPDLPPLDLPPLDDLLRLPGSVREAHGEVETPDPTRSGEDGLTEQEREAARLRLKVDTREDSAGFDPDHPRTRRQAEAGVAVDVDEKTSVRGGVHVEQEQEEEWTSPVPTVGVEKRF